MQLGSPFRRVVLARLSAPSHRIAPPFVSLCWQICLLLGLFSAAFAPSARAQLTVDPTLERGLKPYGTFEGGAIDSVSTTNGNLNLHLPLVSYPQRGGKLSVVFSVIFRNNSYEYTPNTVPACTQKPFVCDYGTVVLGPGMGIVPNIGLTADVSSVIPPFNGPYATLVTPDGSQHEMGPVSGGWRSLDATGYLCVNNCGTIIDRDGIRYTSLNGAGQATRIEDPNGNYISATVNSNGAVTGYLDTMGRTLPIPPSLGTGGTGFTTDFTGCTGTLPTSTAYLWTLPGYQGGSYTVKICYAKVYFGELTCFKSGGAPQCGVTLQNTPIMQSIVLPNNTAWTFQYDSANPNVQGATGTGNLLQITFPTGGYIQYSWGAAYYCQTPSSSTTTTYSYTVATRTVNANDGTGAHTWTYSFGNVPQRTSPYTTTSTDPLGQKTIHTLAIEGGLCAYYETQEQAYNAAGSLLRTLNTDYIAYGDPMTLTGTVTTAADVVPIRVTTTWPNGQVSKIETDFDSGTLLTAPVDTFPVFYGIPIAKREYDYGSGIPGSLLRTTTTTYKALNTSSYLADNLLTLPASVTIAGGSQSAITSYGYDETGLAPSGITSQHDSSPPDGSIRGNQTTISRYRSGSTTQTTGCPVTVSNSYAKTKFSFYDTGETYQTTDPCLNATTFGYSAAFEGAYLTQTTLPTTNGVQHTTSANYDYDTGLVISTTDQNGKATNFNYDGLWRLTSVSYPDGGLGTIARQESTFPFSATLTRSITASLNYVQTDTYDGFGRVSKTQITSDPDGTVNVVTAYDPLGRVQSVSNPYRLTSDSTYGVTSYVYDALGRTCVFVPPDGTIVASGICPSTRPANDVFTSYSGGTTTLTDEAGKGRKSVADGLGRLIQVFEDPSGLNYETDYQYDSLTNLLSVSQKGGSTNSANWRPRSFVYNSLSQLTSATNPESGALSYNYDADGNVVAKTSPAQNQTGSATVTVSYCYDALNRMTGKAYTSQSCPMSSPVAAYSYDQGVPTANPIGRRTGMTDAAGSETWTYDVMGRIAMDQRTTNGVSKTMSYAYNLNGSIASITYPSGDVFSYTYDGAGHPLSVSDTTQGINYITQAHYAPHGALASITGGTNLYATYIYNSRLQPCWIYTTTTTALPWNTTACTNSAGAGTILDLKYNFNLGAGDNGNVYGVTNNLDLTRSQSFAYDPLSRLTSAETTSTFSTSPAHCWGETYQYDNQSTTGAWGNLTGISAASAPYTGCTQESGLSVTVLANNQFSTSNGFGYDSAGNMTSTPNSGAYTYDAENRVVATAGVSYIYDGDGKRLTKSTGKLYWYDNSGDIISELNTSGTVTDSYVFFAGQSVVHRSSTAGIFYKFSDHLATSRVVVASGQTTPCYDADFYPFGGERVYTNTCSLNYKFTGKERDSESGLDNFGARYNSSQYGRFMTADPKQFSAMTIANPQKWDQYPYVLNNPLAFVDPDGQEELKITIRAFIPEPKFKYGPGLTWKGDGRSFSSAPNASSRGQAVLTIETDPSKSSTPLVGKPVVSTSGSAVTVAGLFTATGNSDVTSTVSTNTRLADGTSVVTVSMSASDPLVPGAPSTGGTFTFTVAPDGSRVSMNGSISVYPAYEVNVQDSSTGAQGTLLQYTPAGTSANSPGALLTGATMDVSGRTTLPNKKTCTNQTQTDCTR